MCVCVCESKFKHSINYLKLECTCERKTHISLMNEHVPCLTKSETRSWSSETTASSACISCHVGIGCGPFGLRGTYFHCLTYASFMKWSTSSPLASMQNSQKHAYFRVSMQNVSPMSLLWTGCSSLVPGMVSQFHGIDLFTSPRETSQKNLHQIKNIIYIYNT